MKASGRIRIGIGGWTYAPWRGSFYPQGLAQARELSHAGSVLGAIEINATFYRSQAPHTFAKWREGVPDDLVFTVKAPRYAVTRKVLAEAGESVERFASGGVSELGDKLGPVLWQFAPTKRFEPDDFAAFLELLPDEADGVALRHALEVRHASFLCADFVTLARQRGAAIVWATDSEHPGIADLTSDFAYVRLLGTQERHPLGYAHEVLDRRAKQLAALARGTKVAGTKLLADPAERKPREVFAFVIGGHKVRNPAAALALIERLAN